VRGRSLNVGGRERGRPIFGEADQVPASHFFMKLVFAAPASFLPSFPTALPSQHFFIELILAAPASAFPSLLTVLVAHAARIDLSSAQLTA
jgi:hypothetical protein